MTRRLIGVALALLVVGGVSEAVGKAPEKSPPGVTTLEPGADSGWRTSEDPNDPFTPVGVIGGRSINVQADPANPLTAAQDLPPADQTPTPAKPTAKASSGWLPEPATWALLLIGLVMIGIALRGLLAARRRMTRLEEPET